VDLGTFCDSWLKAWTGNQPELLLSFYASEFFYSDPARPGGITELDEFRTYLNRLLGKYPDWVWQRELLVPTSNGFVFKWSVCLKSGKTFSGMDLVELSQEKISRNEVYFDPSVLKE